MRKDADKLSPLINMAQEDIRYLNTDWTGMAANDEVAYYLLGYLGHILQAASRLQLPETFNEIRKSPFCTSSNIKSANAYSKKINDRDTGETAR
ncbi:hypothetical protein HYW82_00365, partial [Candidatus Peregrinibacteria bacterium]|nr:hypothetical protein [Candidatus Peregrinibacteria bacterium]